MYNGLHYFKNEKIEKIAHVTRFFQVNLLFEESPKRQYNITCIT